MNTLNPPMQRSRRPSWVRKLATVGIAVTALTTAGCNKAQGPQAELWDLWDKDAFLGPVVGWQQLAEFLPANMEGFAADTEPEGDTVHFSKTAVSEAFRQYRDDEATLVVTIIDTARSPMARAPFLYAEMEAVESSDGYQRTARIADNPAVVDWSVSAKRSVARILVAKRYLVWVEIEGASFSEQAEEVASKLNLGRLASLPAKG